MLWTPKWKKEAKLTIKGSKKFINYKRDLIDEEMIKNIKARQQDVRDAIKTKDKKEVKRKCNLLEQECKKSLSSYVRPSWLAENTEVFFVAIVIALGLRAYYLQPFRIPTGSMQPTLNGINSHYLPEDKWPGKITQLFQKGLSGRSYVKEFSEIDDVIIGIQPIQQMRFFTKTRLIFKNQDPITVSCSTSSLKGLGLDIKYKETLVPVIENGKPVHNNGKPVLQSEKEIHTPVKAGQVILEGFVDSGDLLLVDKMSYHFRKPKRGETFVFDTRNIEEIHQFTGEGQDAGAHYIKRCVGVPGDVIQIREDGKLRINGAAPTDKGLKYAMDLTYNRKDGKSGYVYAQSSRPYQNLISGPDDKIILKGEEHGDFAEYAAFGDNTENSLDSRYWGTVREYNLVGPALISLWPFVHEDQQHWGLVK